MTVGSISVNIVANTNKFAKQMKKASASMYVFRRTVIEAQFTLYSFAQDLLLLTRRMVFFASASVAGAVTAAIWQTVKAFKELVAAGNKVDMNKIAGTSLSDKMVAGIMNASKAVAVLQNKFKKLFVYLAAYVAPIVESIAGQISGAMPGNAGMSDFAKSVFDVIFAATKEVVNGFQVVIKLMTQTFWRFREMLWQFRTSYFGGQVLGMGFQNNAARDKEGSTIAAGRGLAGVSTARWGKVFEYGVEKALEKANRATEFPKSVTSAVKVLENATKGLSSSLASSLGVFGKTQALRSLAKLYNNVAMKSFTTETHNKPLAALEAGTQETRLAMRGKTDDTSKKILETNEEQVRLAELANEQLRKLAGPLLGFGIQ